MPEDTTTVTTRPTNDTPTTEHTNNELLPEERMINQSLSFANSTISDGSSSTASTNQDRNSSRLSHIPGAVANLCSATLGAGILALPYALYQAGLICGSILLVSSAWATIASIQVLVTACDKYKMATYESIVEELLGKRTRKLVEISILLFCVGTAVGYVIAVGDVVERVVEMSPGQKRMAMSFVWLCAMLPLSCLRRMQSLQCASGVGIASIVTLLLAATVHLIQHSHDDTTTTGGAQTYDLDASASFTLEDFLKPAEGGWLAVLRACPIVFFAFSCQVNVCQIYDELPNVGGGPEAKVRTMKWVTWLAVGLCGVLYTSISLVSLMDFGESVMPNMLSCYTLTSKETLLHIAFLAMALAIVMAFPLNIFPARVSVTQMIGKHPCNSIAVDDQECQQLLQAEEACSITRYTELEQANQDSAQPQLLPQESSMTNENAESLYSEEEVEDFQAGQHAVITLLLAGLALGLALVIPDISVVFGLLGGTTSALLGFVIPGLMGLTMDQTDITSWVLVIAGSIIGLLTTGVTIYSTFQS
ncbi:unnamed protein product [Cylindrotheca closterium]|uniref:Amino acid transporter transmembrane domain-containing protein n=1 Tax=Cylindrotheca closterium TaxID=2856 RepID=A0AAD2JK82_9STRA|nr:unnamed protein product [Cylindrotheca closterium]